MRPVAAAFALLHLFPAMAASQPLPPALEAFAAEQSAECAGLGGTPRVGPAFATPVDLTGDGAFDYIVDLAGIECANAWSAFCGSAGCPVSIWISRPEGLVREWSDYAQAWRVDPVGDAMGVVVDQHGTACPQNDVGTEACSQRLTFAATPVAAPAADQAADAPAAPSAEEAPAAAVDAPRPPSEAFAAPGADGWTLREVPGSTPVAVSGGPGVIASVAVFCLAEKPWLATTLREPSAAETAQVEFAFSDRSLSSPATREPGAGGALIVELADRPLAGLLAGRDSSTRVSLDGVEQGVMSLRGSTRAIRGALESCMSF